MGIFDGCLLACDVDGTLMANGYINPKNIEKIEYFISEGGKFSIATGRSVGALSDVLDKIRNIAPSIVANGCMIYDYTDNKILFDRVLSKDDYYIAEIVNNCDLNVGIEIHSGDKVFTLRESEETTLHQVYEKLETRAVSFDEVKDIPWHKLLFTFQNSQDRDIMSDTLSQYEIDCKFISTCAVIDGVFQNYLEQVPNGVSKASGIDKLKELLDIKKGKLFAIGDYYNDVQMLNLSDISAVPCDSPEDIKALANYVTCTCKEGAVADFINYLTNEYSKF